MRKQYSMLDRRTQTESDNRYCRRKVEDYFGSSEGDTIAKLRNFTKFVPRQNLSLFLAKNEIFKRLIDVHGHIVECGVFMGGGLLTWAQLSAIFEPYNHVRRIVGFDTFAGFPSLTKEDIAGAGS